MLTLLALFACSKTAPDDGEWTSYDRRGPYEVGVMRGVMEDPERPVELEIWYPAYDGDEGFAVEEFVSDATDRERYAALLEAAPAGCPSTWATATRDAEAREESGGWPLLVFSHCYECVRFSSFSVAEHLASHGFVVAAPEHPGTTLFDALNEDILDIDDEALSLRVGDVRAALDWMLDGGAGIAVDPERVGVFGHSFGSVTTGVVLRDDDRPLSGLGMAAPMEYPLVDSALMSEIDDPLMLVIAVEDNSITELGNELMRSNYEGAVSPAWKLEVEDAGHWSFSDICGLTDFVTPGCGEAMRQTDPDEAFSYLPVSEGIAIASGVTAAFFAETVLGEEGAIERLQLEGLDASE